MKKVITMILLVLIALSCEEPKYYPILRGHYTVVESPIMWLNTMAFEDNIIFLDGNPSGEYIQSYDTVTFKSTTVPVLNGRFCTWWYGDMIVISRPHGLRFIIK